MNLSWILSNPAVLLILALSAGIIGLFMLVSREVAVQLSLWRKGIEGEAQVIRQRTRGGSDGPTYWIKYEFTDYSTSKIYRREDTVSLAHYCQWTNGEIVRTVLLPHNPRISRLADDRLRPLSIFGSGAISLVFPVYIFGISSVLVIFIACFIVFCANLLWINLRSK